MSNCPYTHWWAVCGRLSLCTLVSCVWAIVPVHTGEVCVGDCPCAHWWAVCGRLSLCTLVSCVWAIVPMHTGEVCAGDCPYAHWWAVCKRLSPCTLTGELSAGSYPHMHSLGALAAGKFCTGTLCTLGTPVFNIKHPPRSSVHFSIFLLASLLSIFMFICVCLPVCLSLIRPSVCP